MILFLKLLFAHLVGDFLLQPTSWILQKEKLKAKSAKLYYHIFIHGILAFIFLWDLSLWYIPVILAISHGIIDVIKLYFQQETNRWTWFILDQLAHLTVIGAMSYCYQEMKYNFSALITERNLLLFVAGVFLTTPTSLTIKIFISKWTPHTTNAEDESLMNAGKFIGIFERLLLFVFVMTGHWEAIGFLLTAKSVFRFGDLKESGDRKLTEYIMIGTLLSFGIAISTGLLCSLYLA